MQRPVLSGWLYGLFQPRRGIPHCPERVFFQAQFSHQFNGAYELFHTNAKKLLEIVELTLYFSARLTAAVPHENGGSGEG